MLRRTSVILFLGLGSVAACGGKGPAAGGSGPGSSAPTAAVKLADPTSESIGGIGIGDSAAAVETAFGAPTTKGEVVEWEATGDRTSTWTWDGKGLKLEMAETPGGPAVHQLSVAAPSTFTTSRGVGIGTPFAEVDKIYGEFRGQGRQEGEPERWTAEDGIIVGSVYGGTFFTFVDGKVSSIFVGAGAE